MGVANFHPLKGFSSAIIRLACRTRNVVWILTPNFTNFYIIGGETDDRRKKSLQGGTFGIPPFNICSTSEIANTPKRHSANFH